MKKIGIYCIRNTINNKVYIGKSKNIQHRLSSHKSMLKQSIRHKDCNPHLFNSVKKYGLHNFRFEILELFSEFDDQTLSKSELSWIVKYNATDRDFGFNLRMDSSSSMIVHPETIEKIRKRVKLEWDSGIRKEHSEKLKVAWENRDRDAQSKLLSSTLTKYEYILHLDPIIKVTYSKLCDLGYKNVTSTFHRNNSNDVTFKGVKIERVKIESKT